jgi:hypothetical protein
VLKARREQLNGNLTVMLIPKRSYTVIFHDSIYQKANVEIRFVRWRITFVGAKGQVSFVSMTSSSARHDACPQKTASAPALCTVGKSAASGLHRCVP